MSTFIPMQDRHSFAFYTPLTSMDREYGFCLNDAGIAVVPPISDYPRSMKPHPNRYAIEWEHGRLIKEFQVVYIFRGKGIFESKQGGSNTVNPGDALLLHPGEWHRYRPDPEIGWTEFWIGFKGDYAKRLMSKPFLSPFRPIIPTGDNEALFQLFSGLAKTMHSKPFSNQFILATQGILILAHLITTLNTRSKHNEWIQDVLIYISEHAEQTIDYEAIARNLGLSYSVFRRQFHKITEMPPTQYQLVIRLNKAKELLCTTTLPIGEIADQLGFESPYYFSRFFRDKTGLTARAYRHTSSAASLHRGAQHAKYPSIQSRG